MCKSRNQIVSKFIEKLVKYRVLFKDILTFLGLDYRGSSLLKLYLGKIVIGISIPKIRSIG